MPDDFLQLSHIMCMILMDLWALTVSAILVLAVVL